MTTRPNPADRNTISIGGNVTGNVVAGTGNTVGDVVLGNDTRADLLSLLADLRATIPPSTPKYDAIIENIDDLAAEATKPPTEAEPPVARRLWQKIRTLLTTATTTTTDATKLTDNLTKITTAVATIFGAN